MNPDTRSEIETLLATWARCIDSGRATDAIDLFTADAEQTLPGGTATGRQAIGEGLRRRQALTSRTSRHLVSNLLLRPAAGDAARLEGHWILTIFRSDTQERPALVQLVADVHDQYEQVDGRWLISRRAIAPVFGSP